MMKKKKKTHSNNSGFVTADFIFSFLLASMLTTLLFAMCFTFTVVEIAQYISFSATRAAIPSHKSYDNQRERAQAKLDRLMSDPEIIPLITNGWYELSLKDMRLGQDPSDFYSEEYQMLPIAGEFYVPAAGVRLNLKAKIMELNLGPLGKLESESGNGFNLTIGSLLFREPTQAECQKNIAERYEKILQLDPGYSNLAKTNGADADYMPSEDNGC